jgi:hypothetical protein
MADFEREIEAANERMQAAIKRGPVAVSANYDRRLKRVLVALDTGLSIAFRPADVQGLENAAAADLAVIEISPTGLGLHFPAVDADVCLPGLLAGHFGSAAWTAARMGKAGGQSRSAAKVAASRANGKLGGRPRKSAA